MYCIGKKYKIELSNRIFYTGYVEEEDTTCIRIQTIRNENLILNKDNIVQAIEMNSIGGKDVQKN